MTASICGLDCSLCHLNQICVGCAESGGKPFGGSCMIAQCCENSNCTQRGNCIRSLCKLKQELIDKFNALGIKDMEKVTDLNALWGAYINIAYILPSGQTVKFWDDNRIYLGNQLPKKNISRCYSIAADEKMLLDGANREIVIYKRRKNS